MKKYFLLALFFLSFSATSFSQKQPFLPHHLSEEEKGLISNFKFRSTQITSPPPTAVRAAAEWEEVEYLLVTWVPDRPGILRQIVAAGVNECKVIITTQDSVSVANYLIAGGVSLTNVRFMSAPWNSIWIRDYAANTVYSNEVGDRALVDWIYNRPRPNDDIMPSAHASFTGIPLYNTNSGSSDLVNTGGNYMSDGMGNAFASKLILMKMKLGTHMESRQKQKHR